MEAPTAREYIEMARELHEIEGEIEIDNVSDEVSEEDVEREVSRSDDGVEEIGAYVRAWVWVQRTEIQPEI